MREDTQRALAELEATDSRAYRELGEEDIEALDSNLAPDEELLWLQEVTYHSDPEGGFYVGSIHPGLMGVTTERIVFFSLSAASQWPYHEVQAVQYGRGSRLHGTMAGFSLVLRTGAEGPVFILEKKTRRANDRLIEIMEQGLRTAGIAPRRQATSAQAPAPSSSPSVTEELAKLAEMRQQGILDDEEFAAAKARLLE